jgi:hypothetical protein
MYLPSDEPNPVMTQTQADYIQQASDILAATANMRRTSACGRLRLFNTLVSPSQVADVMGIGAAVNVAKMQAETNTARASGILSFEKGGDQAAGQSGAGPTPAQIIRDAPEVVSLNRGGGCTTPSYSLVPSPPIDSTPGMPHRGPNIEQGPYGPMYYRGTDGTYSGAYPSVTSGTRKPTGLTGYAPRWSDASVLPNGGVPAGPDMGVGSWLMDHPFLALALAGAGVYALSQRSKR